MSNDADILIIGAGAAGLMAGRELTSQGRSVIVLEARDRTGGRIHTISPELFQGYAEAGAEFIHGRLPLTLALLDEAGISYSEVKGDQWHAGNLEKAGEWGHPTDWESFEQRLKELKEDMTIHDFLKRYFPQDQYQALNDSVRGFAQGYDTADPSQASTFALRQEWLEEEETGDPQYRVQGGYGLLTDWLAKKIHSAGSRIQLSSAARIIRWEKDRVTVITEQGEQFQAPKVLVTVPLGVLRAASREPGSIGFEPGIAGFSKSLAGIGYGDVIKVLLEFDHAFWKDPEFLSRIGPRHQSLGMVFSNQKVPTWWTQHPRDSGLLTGWVGGPPAARLSVFSDEQVLKQALDSLKAIFEMDYDQLKKSLTHSLVINWTTDSFSRGSYSYDSLRTAEARKALALPVDRTIYFAGEALYGGSLMGTVEAALVSAIQAVELLMDPS